MVSPDTGTGAGAPKSTSVAGANPNSSLRARRICSAEAKYLLIWGQYRACTSLTPAFNRSANMYQGTLDCCRAVRASKASACTRQACLYCALLASTSFSFSLTSSSPLLTPTTDPARLRASFSLSISGLESSTAPSTMATMSFRSRSAAGPLDPLEPVLRMPRSTEGSWERPLTLLSSWKASMICFRFVFTSKSSRSTVKGAEVARVHRVDSFEAWSNSLYANWPALLGVWKAI
mmetsp:Transcript_26813/g.59329  ORF Transcript_26813/g.59329 Transcript_26813/m.59329 type:complete len:234 (-) Transcript_26813:801-1502(-)